MQVVSAAAMEPPSGGDPQTIKDSQVALFRAVAEADPAHYVRGQYDGYRDIAGVAADSTTETYAALRLDIENWRWSGVPFFIRTGKQLRSPRPSSGWSSSDRPGWASASWRTAAGAQPARRQAGSVDRHPAQARRPARRRRGPGGSTSTWSSPTEGGEGPTPYEVLLHAAMIGDSTRFTRQDGVEETWRIMQPLLDAPPPVHAYAPGSWGPAAADELTAGYGGWHEPVGRRHERRRAATASRAAAERGRPLAVPADRRLRVPVQLPHRRAGRARRGGRLAVRPALRLAQRLRHPARPRRPATSGSARSGSTTRPRGCTSPGRTSS